MKIFISVDIEGVAGITNWEHVRMREPEYEYARRWMTEEVNAAIAGAKDYGAKEYIVTDSHSSMYNLLPDYLDQDALLVRGSPRPLFQMEGLDPSFDAVFLIGYHCMAGSPRAVLCHSHLGDIVYEMRINGVPDWGSGIQRGC
jgi:D-amino peptidase